ncbi:peptidoglycan D,D-transpeptidase FtsI family protein [Paenibacillus rubinfantis]|uniref:peptidoglycan D,D-transpeptidase FtsI family protein n=1 Tax=Paenibacillus rubinfantis TaxID=1720296 RepID=UPI00073E4E32|nr:penicillin-binding protein 2 [Paenibacillus rubinfantis]
MSLLRKKRIFYLLLSFAAVLGLFALRIAWIQTTSAFRAVTVGGKTINELAVRQREESIELDPGRGHIFDRNGKALTGEIAWTPILFPVRRLPEDSQLTALATVLKTTVPELRSTWERLERPYVWPKPGGESGQPLRLDEATAHTLPRIEGLEVLPYMARYGPGDRGNQWLGFVTQRPDVIRKLREHKHQPDYAMTLQVGAAGLEKTLDGFLRGLGGVRAAYTVDGRKDPLGGMGTRVNANTSRYYPLQIQTTIDDVLQQKLERLAVKLNVTEGAVVVLDVKTADIVSMVSLPFYDPHHVDPALENWGNKAVKAFAPGSIFKTVIAAAALEEHVTAPGEVFHCNGQYGKYGLSCWKEGGHGNLTLEEGFAKSCNVVFATLGERLNADVIARTAAKLGIGRSIGWRDPAFLGGDVLRPLDQEEAGALFSNPAAVDGGVLAQTAIGQRDVLVSPLQAANLVVTLLHGGQVKAPRLVREIRYKDGSLLSDLPVQASPSSAGQIHPQTANRLLSWMRLVVTDGTGRTLQQAKWPLAGKSGTAEVLKNNEQRNNQWFIGYGPVDRPQYAVAVLVQNRPKGSKHLAAELFRRTMDVLASQG